MNSGKTLGRCLESVKEFADVIVLDGNSTDNTIEIAKQYDVRIFPQKESSDTNIKIDDFSAVRNKGIEYAKYSWFLFIDSDEYLSPEAVREIAAIVELDSEAPHFLYWLPRRYIVDGKVIERSSMYPNYQMRFFHIPATTGFIKKLHERINPKPGYRAGYLTYPEYVPFGGWRELRKKWRNYAASQIAHTPIPLARLVPYTFTNILTFCKYVIKILLTFVTGSGPRMPLPYEWYNAMYHIQLIAFAWLEVFRLRRTK